MKTEKCRYKFDSYSGIFFNILQERVKRVRA